MPTVSRMPTLYDHSDDPYATLIKRQQNTDKKKATHKSFPLVSTGLTVAAQFDDGGPWTNR